MSTTVEVITHVLNQLMETHDVKNTLIRLSQLASNIHLMLTPGQRGALNYFSTQTHLTESELVELLKGMIDNNNNNQFGSSSSSLPPSYSPLSSFDYIVQQESQTNQYKWCLVQIPYESDHESIFHIDNQSYSSLSEAQTRAQSFLNKLYAKSEQELLHVELIKWWKHHSSSSSVPCFADILFVQENYYVLLNFNNINDMNTKTVQLTNKIVNMKEQLFINPSWIVRGKRMSRFFIVFKLELTSSLSSLSPQFIQQLQQLLCI
jgi:hypothetical protein